MIRPQNNWENDVCQTVVAAKFPAVKKHNWKTGIHIVKICKCINPPRDCTTTVLTIQGSKPVMYRYDLMCVWCVSLQICSPAEKKAIDKMIDSGPQLAGSMEYNVVLSEYLEHVMFPIKQECLHTSKLQWNYKLPHWFVIILMKKTIIILILWSNLARNYFSSKLMFSAIGFIIHW